MGESARLADQLHKALQSDAAWYGPSWKQTLEGLSFSDALRRPVAHGHSIGEIVLHTITWHEVATKRLTGGTPPQPTDEEDWRKATFDSDTGWEAVKHRLFVTGAALADAIGAFPDAQWDEQRPNNAGTWYNLACGMLQHDLYHLGQVGLLKKAAEKAPVS